MTTTPSPTITITTDQFDALLSAIKSVEEVAIKALNANVNNKEVLNLHEVAAYLNLAESSVEKLCSARAIPYYKQKGFKCFFRKSEIDKWRCDEAFRVHTHREMDREAITRDVLATLKRNASINKNKNKQ